MVPAMCSTSRSLSIGVDNNMHEGELATIAMLLGGFLGLGVGLFLKKSVIQTLGAIIIGAIVGFIFAVIILTSTPGR